MKKHTLYALIILFAINALTLRAQECHSLVGKNAPEFKAQAVTSDGIKDISLADYHNWYKILVFYPADFSFVCPTELRALQEKLPQFKEKNAHVIGISVDQVYTHQAWLDLPEDKGGVKGITYPLISDVKKEISLAYGALDASGVSQRATIIIDDKNIVQSVSINNLSIGRNVDEILRILDAIQFHKEHGEVCPVNWEKGKKAIEPTKNGLENYLHTNNQKEQS